jgi:hypothetical protein
MKCLSVAACCFTITYCGGSVRTYRRLIYTSRVSTVHFRILKFLAFTILHSQLNFSIRLGLLAQAYTIDDATDQLSDGRLLLDAYPDEAEIWMQLIGEHLSAAFNDH